MNFSNLEANLTNKKKTESNFTTLLNSLPDQNYDRSFHLNHTNYNEVYNKIIRGHDNNLVRYLKSIAEYISSPMVHIINT